MSNGFTFDGVHSDTVSLLVNKKNIPITPPLESRLQSISGFDGAWDYGVSYAPRPIEIECTILADSPSDLKNKIRSLAKTLNPRKGAKPLIFDDEPEVQYFARLSNQIPLEQLGSMGTFTLQFICPDPFTYGVDEVSFKTIENVIENGDFSNGLTGWTSYPSGADIALALNGDYLTFTADTDSEGLVQDYDGKANHQYYFRFTANSPDAVQIGYGVIKAGLGAVVEGATVSSTDTVISRIMTSSYFDFPNLVFGRRTGTFNLKKYVTVIDLTECFGAGNEPTLAEMDAMIAEYPNNWFDGKVLEPIVHEGTHVAKPTITVTHGGGSGTITNTHPDGTVETLTFASTSVAGTYSIDCKEMTITKDGAAAYNDVSGDFFSFPEGTNIVRLTGGISNAEITIRNTWL